MFVKLCKSIDIPQIIDIENSSLKNPWSCEQYETHLANKGVLFALLINDQIVGFISAKQILDEIEIYRIAVDKNFRRKGVANKLYSFFKEEALKNGAKDVFLEVRESNCSAIKFYSSAGFKVVGKRNAYYSDGENATIMNCNLAD